MSETKSFGVSSPWITLYKKIYVLFKHDPEVEVIFEDNGSANKSIKLYVDNVAKAEALEKLLPASRVYGNITVYITVIPPNVLNGSMLSAFETAFKGNPALSYVHTSDGGEKGLFAMNYVVFQNKVVQFFNDELGDVNGMCSTLYQDIARELFDAREGIFFCTDVPKNEGETNAPLGEWP